MRPGRKTFTRWAMTTRQFQTLIAAALLSAVVSIASCVPTPSWAEAAPPAAISAAVTNYTRMSDDVATAGLLGEGAIGALKAAGFATILDLRGPDEGTDAEKRAAEAAGLKYFNIPVTTLLPSGSQVVQFSRVVADRANLPVLVHCVSGNRVGAMWALYRAKNGVPAATAIEEGRRIGMRGEREAAAMKSLGLAP
jgi:uncharacterized protein (TIGR01244 family)